MVEIVFIIPLITGIIAFFLPRTAGRPLLVITGAVHLFYPFICGSGGRKRCSKLILPLPPKACCR